jgi:predicted nucleic acid-binding protein
MQLVKVLLDTSVLVASCLTSHPAFQAARAWLLAMQRGELAVVVSAHTLLEAYSVLTRLPDRQRVGAAEAYRILRQNLLDAPACTVAALTSDQYASLLERISHAGVVGGVVYDAAIVAVAVSARADAIVTLNTRDFVRVAGADGIRVVSADEPPASLGLSSTS